MSKNDITGDNLKSRPNSKAFEEGMARIFGIDCYECKGHGRLVIGEFATGEKCKICCGIGKILL